MKRKIDNYRDLFDDDFLDILIRDVLQEHVKILLDSGDVTELPVIEHLLKVVEYFSVYEDYAEFLKEIGYE